MNVSLTGQVSEILIKRFSIYNVNNFSRLTYLLKTYYVPSLRGHFYIIEKIQEINLVI
jgi:hypothetical protein